MTSIRSAYPCASPILCPSHSVSLSHPMCLSHFVSISYAGHVDNNHPNGILVGKVINVTRRRDDSLYFWVFSRTRCSLTHSLTSHHRLTGPLALTDPPTHPLTHSSTHPLTSPRRHPPTLSLRCSSTRENYIYFKLELSYV